MLPLILAGGGAALGLGKSFLDKGKEGRQRDLRAAQIRYSPWTNRQSFQDVEEADWMGNIMSGGLAGASMGQNLAAADFLRNAKFIPGPYGGMFSGKDSKGRMKYRGAGSWYNDANDYQGGFPSSSPYAPLDGGGYNNKSIKDMIYYG
jgi:hypothetical protein